MYITSMIGHSLVFFFFKSGKTCGEFLRFRNKESNLEREHWKYTENLSAYCNLSQDMHLWHSRSK